MQVRGKYISIVLNSPIKLELVLLKSDFCTILHKKAYLQEIRREKLKRMLQREYSTEQVNFDRSWRTN